MEKGFVFGTDLCSLLLILACCRLSSFEVLLYGEEHWKLFPWFGLLDKGFHLPSLKHFQLNADARRSYILGMLICLFLTSWRPWSIHPWNLLPYWACCCARPKVNLTDRDSHLAFGFVCPRNDALNAVRSCTMHYGVIYDMVELL